MNKKGRAGLVIFGIPVGVIIMSYIWFFVIGPAIDKELGDALEKLGSDSICPDEFKTAEYNICFTKDGDVIANGKLNEDVGVEISGTGNSCKITRGHYSFEYSGCRLDNFKQVEAYNLILVTRNGKIILKGTELFNDIIKGTEIITIAPKGLRILREIVPFVRFLGI